MSERSQPTLVRTEGSHGVLGAVLLLGPHERRVMTTATCRRKDDEEMPLEKMPVVLTSEERAMRAHEAARLLAEYGAREERKKEVVKELTDELKELRAQADAAAQAANTGVEEREVPVSPRANNERFVIEYFRDDTGDLVRTRPMTDDESRVARQTVLPLRSVGQVVSPLRGTTKPPIPNDGKPS